MCHLVNELIASSELKSTRSCKYLNPSYCLNVFSLASINKFELRIEF